MVEASLAPRGSQPWYPASPVSVPHLGLAAACFHQQCHHALWHHAHVPIPTAWVTLMDLGTQDPFKGGGEI